MIDKFLNKYFNDLIEIFKLINPKDFEEFINELIVSYENEKMIFIFGNGGSGSNASHFVCDINKGVSFDKKKKFKLLCLNDNIPIMLAYSNDVSYNQIFIQQLKNFLKKDDLVIGISGSGNSENVINAINYANDNKARTFGLIGFNGGKLRDIAQKCIIVNSNDMQKVEDMHSIILHCAMQYLNYLT